MPPFGKVQAALTAVTQETTLALANTHFDFALVKIEAPAEYRDLGAALSVKRRKAAEDGSTHETARKLGALFQETIPSTPNLFKAYGLRASEIAQSPIINPRDGRSYGAFADHVGVDGTSIWAAATSGTGALAIHLLACMLARIWPASEAISIWEEILEERRKELSTFDESNTIPVRNLTMGRISLSRDQLAEWDASARAWLRAADKAKELNQKQLLLIIGNLSMPVNTDMKVYASVMLAWRTAMSTIDKLIEGVSQSIQNGAVLLGLSAWHLYPDLIVLGSIMTSVRQHDHLIAPGGTVTLGLQGNEPENSRGVYWSLPLTHVRYYGDPMMSQRSVDFAQSRISIEDLWQVVMASLINTWGNRVTSTARAVELISLLWWECEKGLDTEEDFMSKDQVRSNSWLRNLGDAANRYLDSIGHEKASCRRLFGLGQRKCTLLGGSTLQDVPIFGFSDASLLRILKTDERIQYLRRVAFKYAKEGDVLVIKTHSKIDGKVKWLHLASVFVPILAQTAQFTDDKNWLYDSDELDPRASSLKQALPVEVIDGEKVYSLDPDSIVSLKDDKWFQWSNPPSMYSESVRKASNRSETTGSKRRVWGLLKGARQRIEEMETPVPVATFEYVFGDVHSAALFRRRNLEGVAFRKIDRTELEHNVEISVDEVIDVISSDSVDSHHLWEHFKRDGGIMTHEGDRQKNCATVNDILRGLATITKIYSNMPSATVSLDIINFGMLLEAKWLQPNSRTLPSQMVNSTFYMARNSPWLLSPLSLSRSATFSCIAMLESGGFNLDPEDLSEVMAISSGDSIFVAASILSDPGKRCESDEVRRIVGNLGRAGIAFLIPPQNPRIKKLDLDAYHVINHDVYNGMLEDCFRSTSLHLEFSGYELAFDVGDHGGRNREAFFLESLIRVHDRGAWIADLDALGALEGRSLYISEDRKQKECTCRHSGGTEELRTRAGTELIAIDRWEELLERPRGAGVVRAHGNWVARLAAAALSVKMGYKTVVASSAGHVRCRNCLFMPSDIADAIYIM